MNAVEPAYATHGSMEYRNPDNAGPMMMAAVQVAENNATVRGIPPSGAPMGGIARIDGAWNARAMPYPKATR